MISEVTLLSANEWSASVLRRPVQNLGRDLRSGRGKESILPKGDCPGACEYPQLASTTIASQSNMSSIIGPSTMEDRFTYKNRRCALQLMLLRPILLYHSA